MVMAAITTAMTTHIMGQTRRANCVRKCACKTALFSCFCRKCGVENESIFSGFVLARLWERGGERKSVAPFLKPFLRLNPLDDAALETHNRI